MRKTICIFALIFLLMNCAYAAEESDIKIIVNEREVVYDVKPYVENQSVLVPLRKTLEVLGMNVSWDDETKTVFAFGKGTAIVLKLNSQEATVMDKKVQLIAPPLAINGRVLVPLRFVAESVGGNVTWEQATKTVRIDTVKNAQGQVVDKVIVPPVLFE